MMYILNPTLEDCELSHNQVPYYFTAGEVVQIKDDQVGNFLLEPKQQSLVAQSKYTWHGLVPVGRSDDIIEQGRIGVKNWMNLLEFRLLSVQQNEADMERMKLPYSKLRQDPRHKQWLEWSAWAGEVIEGLKDPNIKGVVEEVIPPEPPEPEWAKKAKVKKVA